MTYEEAYMQCETKKELEEMVARDISIANFCNKDRLPTIKKFAEKVANLKFKEDKT